HVSEAYDAFHSLGLTLYEMTCERMLAWMAMSEGNLDEAARLLQHPLELLSAFPDSLHVPHTLGCAALIRARRGDPSALDFAADGVASARRFPVPQVLVMTLARAAEVAVLLERPFDARPHVVELVTTLRQL